MPPKSRATGTFPWRGAPPLIGALRKLRAHSGRTPALGRVAAIASSLVLLMGLVAFAATASAEPGAGAAVDEHPGLIETEENNCFETNDRRPVLLAEAEAYVPDRYTVRSFPAPPPPAWLGTPGVATASVGFIDYVCESLSVNGHRPRPTIVSIGTVLVTRDNVNATYALWVGTDNPLLFARLRQLGVEAYFLPRSSYSETTNQLGQRVITVDYVGAGPTGLNYTRTITVLTTPAGPTSQSIGTMYHLGRKGEVRFRWLNTVLPTGTANVCFEVAPGSLPTEYGITSFCYPAPRQFFRGSWTGTHELLESGGA